MSGKKQLGAVLVFKPGVSADKAKQALKDMGALLEYQPGVNQFDPAWGGPVWYIP